MRTHATKHAINRVGKTILKNCQILENLLGILSFPSPILRFPSPKIQFSSPKIQFSLHEIRFTQIGFLLSSTVSAFFNGFLTFFNDFPLSPTAFRISPTAFQFSSTAFRFPRNPRKSIYGEKYTKDRYSSFVFFATRSPSFVITDKQYLRDYPTSQVHRHVEERRVQEGALISTAAHPVRTGGRCRQAQGRSCRVEGQASQ